MDKISRLNNFDFLRLLLALLVIVSHSYLITGNKSDELLFNLSNKQEAFGSFAVKSFLVISGYLIFQSLERSDNILDYLWKRIIRIYPGLIVMLLSILSIIPLFYQSDHSILQNKSYLSYFFRQASLYNLQDVIDGVFEDSPSQIINGSLWTIAYEFTMYIMMSILIFIKKGRHLLLLSVFLFSYYLILDNKSFFLNNFLFSKVYLKSNEFYQLLCFFTAGGLLTKFNFKNIQFKNILLIFALSILVLTFVFEIYNQLKYIVVPIVIILIGVQSTPLINKVGLKLGDLSYGVYIYGWFVQQLVFLYLSENIYQHILLSSLITIILAYLSWHLVEKKALQFKNVFNR